MGAVGRAKASDKKSIRLATAAAAIFSGSIHHRQEHSVAFLFLPPSRVDNRNFVCELPNLKKTHRFNKCSDMFLSHCFSSQPVSAGL